MNRGDAILGTLGIVGKQSGALRFEATEMCLRKIRPSATFL